MDATNGILNKTDHRLPHRLPLIQPRIIIHGGAGNISRATITPERGAAIRKSLKNIITRTNEYMTSGASGASAAPKGPKAPKSQGRTTATTPSALDIATFAVVQLEDCSLFNSGHGAVFTRDGINELEASVMVSRDRAKRGVGVMGLRHVRNPIRLAQKMLEHGDHDLGATSSERSEDQNEDINDDPKAGKWKGSPNIDAGAQGHTQIYGDAAEALADLYGLPLVHHSYFFTQQRWDEHVRALEAEKQGQAATSTWSASEYLPQGTCGAVALDADGVVCCATSTGGLTNKVTGRVGDTPVVGAGSWAGTWAEDDDPTGWATAAAARGTPSTRPVIELSRALYNLLADCLPIPSPMPLVYSQLPSAPSATTTRSIAVSGTGNGDSFLRVSAAHTVAAMAQYKPLSSADALSAVAGPGGVLQKSAGDRWGLAGEGEGGLIGIECAVVEDSDGRVQQVRTAVIQDYNCGGMFRAWIDDNGQTQVRIFRDE
ncbi:hypothetical protein Sste5346_000909 [Sporothrix stenoceras]|uniref:L-asparaginase n=1 Tax=Sporothrix stenoceras TaxID=5173 RepID=A0ABR3ZS27_9PEZI